MFTSKIKFLLLIIPLSLVLYYQSLSYYFFQDDWFVLNWVENSDFISLFKMRSDIIYWRPLSMPVLFKLNLESFGLTHSAFHLITFLFFLFLLISIYKLFANLARDKTIAALATFFYATSATHFISLSWLSTSSYIFGTLFMVLSIYSFLGNKPHGKSLSIVFLILALLSSELALVTPLILVLCCVYLTKKINYKFIALQILVVATYLVVRLSLSDVPASGSYSVYADKKILANLIWYFLWGFNMPESFSELISHKFPSYSALVIKQNLLIVLSSTATAISFLGISLSLARKTPRIIIFGSLWFILGLAPVLVIPDHTYPNYLAFSLLGLVFLLSNGLVTSSHKFSVVICSLWLLSSTLSLGYTRKTHWIVNEQAISKAYTNYILQVIEKPPSNSVFILDKPSYEFANKNHFYFSDMKTLYQSLNGNSAMKVVFNSKSVDTIYTNLQAAPALEGKNTFFIQPM